MHVGARCRQFRSTAPNYHDFEELAIIYNHLDSTTTVSAAPASSKANADVPDDPSSWSALVSQSRNGRSSTYDRFNADGSKTITHVFWTVEAAAGCPSCDHRYGDGR